MDISGLDRETDGRNAAGPERARRRRGGFGRALAFILLALLLTLVLLPRILSSARVRVAVLARVNAGLAPRRVDVDDWTLRWLAPLSFTGIRVEDPARGLDARVASVTVSRGLLKLLPFGKVNAGEIAVSSPDVRLAVKRPEPAGDKEQPPPEQPEKELPFKDLALKLTVANGCVELSTADAGSCRIDRLEATVELTSLREPVAIKGGANVPIEGHAGRVEVDGRLMSPMFFLAGAEAPPEKLSARVGDLDLRSLQPLLQALTGEPWIRSGVVDASASVTLLGPGAAEVDTDVAVRRLSIRVPGRSDTPVGDLLVRADLTRDTNGIAIRTLSLTSPWAGVAAQGRLAAAAGGPPLGRVRAKADVNLAALVRDFAPLLKLSDNLKVERGRLTADVDIEATPEARSAFVAVETSDLSVRLGSESVAIIPAPSLRARVRLAANEPPEVKELRVTLPFAQLSGSGRLDAAKMSGSVDLTAFARDFKRVLKECPPMVGRLDLVAETRREADRVRAHVALSASDLAAELKAATSSRPAARLVVQKGALTFDGVIPLRAGALAPEIGNAVWSLEADGGRVSGGWTRLVLPGEKRNLLLQGFKAAAEADLAAVARAAQPLMPLPAGAVLEGKWVANATAEAADQSVKARFAAAVSGLGLTTTAWNIRDPDVRADGAVEFNAGTRELKATAVRFASLPLKADVPAWQVRLPAPAQKTGVSMSGSATGTLDLAALSAWRRPPAEPRQPPPAVRGNVMFGAQASSGADGTRVAINAEVVDLAVAAPGARPFEEKRAELKAVTSLSADGQTLTLDSVSVASTLAALTCAGRIAALQKEQQCDLTGTLAVDFEAVTAYLRAMGFSQVKMTGRQARAFELHGALANGPQALLSFGRARGALAVGGVTGYGLTAGPADLAFTLDKGIAGLLYEPSLDGGTLRLKPSVEVAVKPMILDLPDGTRVLENVPLTQGLVDELLARVNPLLRQCAALGGRMDLIVQDCRVPLGPQARQEATVKALINLRDVKLMPRGALADLIALAGMEPQMMLIRQYTIRAEIRDGRVRPEPITITINDVPVVFTGTVGLDKSVAYMVDIPLGEGVIGREAWKYLKGERIRVPVTGTIGNIRLDGDAVRAEVKRLVRKALEKAAVEKLGGVFDQLRKNIE